MIKLNPGTPLRILLCSTLLFYSDVAPSQAQNLKDSAVNAIQKLSSQYRKNVLTEKQYLDSIQRTMLFFQSRSLNLSNKELLGLLSIYREVIWENKHNENFKQAYYSILSNQARLEGRNGEMFYYAEKLSELEESYHSASITSLSFLVSYYYAHLAFSKSLALYKKNRKFIASIPQMVLKQQLERRELMRSADAISCFGMAASKLSDSMLGREIEGIMHKLTNSVGKQYSNDKEILSRLKYSTLMYDHEKHLSLKQHAEIWKDILGLDSLLKNPNTPDYLKSYIEFTTTDKKALFFLETVQNDSARFYIDLLNQFYSDKLDPMNAYMVKKYEARLLYNLGFFKSSEDTLIKALEILEATNQNSETEIDEVMYALTKVEEQQFLLADSAKKQRKSDNRLMILGFGTFLLLGGSGFVFGIVRRRQKMRFVNFKLNLARNIHDETNPALLYAKMLAKKQRVSYLPEQKGELEAHIELTMELMRSLSHDLKSTHQFTISDLFQNIRGILEKMSLLSGFSYSIQGSSNKKRFLSHYQYHNLNAILQECIANSIKHAEFNHVTILFTIDSNVLKFYYNDDGKGWPGDNIVAGIGLQNIQDRIEKLNGDILIKNSYPDGYRIEMSIKLS
jgi:signal transduction histidine kinase